MRLLSPNLHSACYQPAHTTQLDGQLEASLNGGSDVRLFSPHLLSLVIIPALTQHSSMASFSPHVFILLVIILHTCTHTTQLDGQLEASLNGDSDVRLLSPHLHSASISPCTPALTTQLEAYLSGGSEVRLLSPHIHSANHYHSCTCTHTTQLDGQLEASLNGGSDVRLQAKEQLEVTASLVSKLESYVTNVLA